jgi:uncharacterized membrane protein YhaH (DUF805 family)
MDPIWIYLLQIITTTGICLAVFTYFRPYLRHILLDLCGTYERAQFWVVFSSILLVGLPLIFALGYNPMNSEPGMEFYATANQVRLNLLGLIFALLGIGCMVSVFALLAPSSVAKK